MQLAYVEQGYIDEETAQTAKEHDTKLEVVKHPAPYYQVDRRLTTRLVYSGGPYGKKL